MKIVQICRQKYKVPPHDNGSIEWLNYWLSEELIRRGHEVISYVPMGSTCKGQTIYYPSKTMNEKELQEFVLRTLPKDADIIHDHTDSGDIAKGKFPIPTIWHCHAYKRAGHGIPLYVSRTILEEKGKKAGYFLHNGIKVEDYQFRMHKDNYLLFLGRIVRQKGVHDAIQVAKQTGRRLIIAGTVNDKEYFLKHIKPHLNKQIQYAGPVSGQKKLDLLKKAYCLIFPTNFEDPFPLVPLEALACGTPVAAYRRGGLPEQLTGMKELLCSNLQEMVAFIKKGKFPEPKECRRYVENYYTIEVMVDHLLQIYHSILMREADRTENIRLSYGGILPKPEVKVFGGKVKLLHLGDIYPETNENANILYLVSSALPNNAAELVRSAKKKGIKIVWNQNGVAYPAWAGSDYDRRNVPMREIIHQADWVIYQSKYCKESADKYLGPYTGPHSIVYNCADAASFKPRPTPLSSQPIKLLVMGSHHQHQRVTLALETVALLRKRNIPVRLTVAGRFLWGPHAREDVNKKIRALGLEKDVSIIGSYRQKDAPSLYRNSHILLHFKYNDPCPTVPIEAMCCGIPVIASDSGGMTELLKGIGGITLKVPKSWEKEHYPSPVSAAEAILALMKDWKNRSGKTAKHAKAAFGKEKWLKDHREIFNQVLLGRP